MSLDTSWLIKQTDYKKEHHSFNETNFALSNGYIGIRHTLEFESIYAIPGTFLANIYDPGIAVPMEIVNVPQWLPIKLFIDDIPINLDKVEILEFERILNMQEGTVSVSMCIKDSFNRITSLKWLTLVHLKEYHLGLVSGSLCAENHASKITLCSYLDYRFGNSYLGGYLPSIQTKHYQLLNVEGSKEKGLYLAVKTLGTQIEIAEAAKILVDTPAQTNIIYERDRIGEAFVIQAKTGEKYHFTKYVTFFTSNDTREYHSVGKEALFKYINRGYQDLKTSHTEAWHKRWETADVKINGDRRAQQSIRFGIFHLLQSVHPEKNGTNIAARGLTSEYHSGHFFFNTELYKLNYFTAIDPETARSLLLFRYNTLAAAKQQAAENGYQGAKYPEEADHRGYLAAPKTIKNYFSGETFQEWSGIEVKHLSADVAYAIQTYYQNTFDDQFILNYGLEMLIETARFGVSLLEWDKHKQQFVISSVMCLDEYHYHVNNHYYTNYMVKWNIEYAIQMINEFSQNYPTETARILNKTALTDNEIACWQTICSLIFLADKINGNLIEQFEGYYELPDQKISQCDENLRPVLSTEDEEKVALLTNIKTRLIKQADVIMLLAMFPARFSAEEKRQNFDFYEPRTVHESSLSAGAYGLIACELGEIEKAYTFFLQSARYNLDFIPKENYRNGIHVASYAAAWQLVVQGFAGIKTKNDQISIDPNLPPHWESLEFCLYWRNSLLNFRITQKLVSVDLVEKSFHRVIILIGNGVYELEKNLSVKIA